MTYLPSAVGVMFPHYTDTTSIYEGLVIAQHQQQDDVSSTDVIVRIYMMYFTAVS